MSSTDWPQLVVEDASVQIIHLDEIIVHGEFSEAFAEQDGFFLVKSPGGATKLFRHLVHLLVEVDDRVWLTVVADRLGRNCCLGKYDA